jgi:hypothetical protein
MTGYDGGALGAPLWVALLSVLSRGQRMEWSGMLCLLLLDPLKSNLIPYITR